MGKYNCTRVLYLLKIFFRDSRYCSSNNMFKKYTHQYNFIKGKIKYNTLMVII